jgi:predicted secreted protein
LEDIFKQILAPMASFLFAWATIWWVVVFMVLPLGMNSTPRWSVKRKMWITSLVSLLLAIPVFYLFYSGKLTLRQLIGV